MEDGAKEEPTQCKEPKFLGKAGWVKKAPGRLLATYKDRYIHVERTEVVVYENEDLQNCLERFDLENYDKCHELKSPFKRKHRLILIRSPKAVNKVHDVKFQAQTAEEKEAWIKALCDGINRAKNKIFDEVKIDESNNLEHVTRTRPKGNRNRRPPTRIHMKEVADVSSDGILRLDLDLENALMPNGTHQTTVDGTETPKDSIKSPEPSSNDSETTEKQTPLEDSKNEPEVTHPKKVLKPPMPPIKEAKPSATPEDEANKDDGSGKKVVMPPMPPSKEAKPSAPSAEGATEEPNSEEVSEKSPDAKKKAGPPPTPPNKPSSSTCMSNTAEASQTKPNAPTPPSKEKKPSHQAVEPDQEVEDTTEENKGKEEHKKEVEGTAGETDESEEMISKGALPCDKDDQSECPTTEVSEEKSGETVGNGSNNSSDHELPSPPLTSNKESEKPAQQHTEDKKAITDTSDELDTASDTSASSPQAEEAPPKSEALSVVVSLNDPVTDSLSLSPLLSHSPGQKKKMAEEKSVDSGQHSDDDSEISGSEDTLAASTAALRGSSAGLDVFDTSEDDVQISSQQPKAVTKPQVRPKVFPHRSQPTPPAKPLIKARSASSGDLLSDSSACPQVRQPSKAVAENDGTPKADDVMKLQAEVALEMEKTSRLLSTVSQSQKGGDGESMPEDLLAKAMEKLMKADNVLREVEKLKPAKNSSNRKSW